MVHHSFTCSFFIHFWNIWCRYLLQSPYCENSKMHPQHNFINGEWEKTFFSIKLHLSLQKLHSFLQSTTSYFFYGLQYLFLPSTIIHLFSESIMYMCTFIYVNSLLYFINYYSLLHFISSCTWLTFNLSMIELLLQLVNFSPKMVNMWWQVLCSVSIVDIPWWRGTSNRLF